MEKGRSKELVRLRDKYLIRRYNYYTKVKHLRFDFVLEKLSREEFFLSEQTIMTIIRKGTPGTTD